MGPVRTYLASFASGGALLAAAVAGLVTVAALVAFDGLPTSSNRSDDSAVLVESSAPEIAAVAATARAASPAASPAVLPDAGPSPDPTGAPERGGDANPGSGGPTIPAAPTSPGTPVVPPAGKPGPIASQISGVIGQIEDAVGDAGGPDLGLGTKTRPLTEMLDETAGTLTDAGPGGLGLG